MLRTYLAQCLPEYLLPSTLMNLPIVPLTPSGNLDRRALPTPDVSHLSRHPAPRSPAERLAGIDASRGAHALAARRTGNAPALFALPTGTGDIAYVFELSAHLDPDVPVYALPWPEVMPASMDALAAHMVELMRSVLPHGPYRLLGYSSGGLLAYAVAQHLAELDERVHFVGLLDCGNPAMPPIQEAQEACVKHRLAGELAQLVQQDKHRERQDLQEAVRQLEENLESSTWAEVVAWCETCPALQALAEREQTSIGQFAVSCMRMAAYETLWPTYLAQPLPAPLKLHLFYATEEAKPPQPLAWDRLLPLDRINVIPVPGTHSSMVGLAHIGELGRAVSQALGVAHGVSSARHAPALALQSSRTTGVPIVCVPGAGASITSFVELGIALGADQTLIGMQPRGVGGHRLAYGSVERAATAYLDAMRPHVPPGAPVHLLGHSFGGWVVFEMAQQLKAAGAAVASLTLIDVEAPDDTPGVRDCSRDEVIDRFLEALALHVDKPLPIDRASLRGMTAEALVEALHRLMVDIKLMPARSKPDALRGPLFTFARACRTRYCPLKRYDGPVQLVLVPDTRLDPQADERQREQIEKRWRVQAPKLTVWRGPGNHMTILNRPHVNALAGWWREAGLGAESTIEAVENM